METNYYPQRLFNPLYDLLVPQEGRSDTLEGEILRALARISHIYYNEDGEFFHGFGAILAGPAASFLKDKCSNIEELEEVPEILHRMTLYSISYDEGIMDLEITLNEYIRSLDGKYTPNDSNMMDYPSNWDDSNHRSTDFDHYDE